MNIKRKKNLANIIIIALILCGIGWISSLFIHIGGEYTNNAQIKQNIVPVSSRVQGFIKEVRFDDFQYVKKGDTLVVIEDSEYKLRLAQAEADYQNALTGKSVMGTTISTTQNNLSVTDAGIREVEILFENAKNELGRYQNLLEKNAVTRQQFDAVKTEYESLKAKMETMERQKQSTQLAKQEQIQRLGQNDAGIDIHKAALDLARLNLSYTVILAPCDGYTSRKAIQIGELVMPGNTLFSVVNNEEIWVVANYRETQRRHIKVGSKVDIEIDAFPDTKFEGEVSAISNATGAQYSISSPDHSAGNFVKVEQRIPVKILFTQNNNKEMLSHLGAGMNVECKIIY
ncbi:MAG: HlyD family secretion protein [Dysgonamonadaceae bacterium]|nr:HlyD family secretion protein [Dysgonamonadaceae bacterium]MDD3309147.1 HlyD family secretion protein [Dysgonamonadaceae bacterium]MDD3899798.1 HlyD family secretion protein [Dysgonamonadaceae bacterium]MDD4398632.1 HlyD family secretion protein [Dysgonamonadaceae bacterium]